MVILSGDICMIWENRVQEKLAHQEYHQASQKEAMRLNPMENILLTREMDQNFFHLSSLHLRHV